MASLDDLKGPQRATLQLLLKQGKSYDEIAELLKSSSSSVQSRAQAAVRALGPEHPDIGADRRSEIADYLLGQQAASQRAATREYLEDSADGSAWARSVAAALQPLSDDALPDVPAEPSAVDDAFAALRSRAANEPDAQRGSQLGTRIMFGAAGILVAVVLIVALGIFGGDDSPKPKTTTVTNTTPQETPQAVAEGVLRPPKGSDSKASGQMGIILYKSRDLFKLLVVGKDLKPAPEGTAHGIWLYTSEDDAAFVGFPKTKVDAKGELQVVADLPPSTRTYREVLVTRESAENPKKPGKVLLRGALLVAKQQAPAQTQTTPQTQTEPQAQTRTEPG